MPGAPSFIALDWERHRFGHGVLANHQIHKKNVNSPGDHEITLPGSNT